MELPSALIPFALATSGSPDNHAALLCPEHKIEKCSACDVDFSAVNYLQRFLRLAPADAVPPPPNNVHPQRAEQVRQAKEQGNAAFKAQQYPQSIRAYSASADMALSRAPWELATLSRDECTVALCNRSAAFAALGQWSAAYSDAEAVVRMKRSWGKGHFRKARALEGLGRIEDAQAAIQDGLQFEPDNQELNAVAKELMDRATFI